MIKLKSLLLENSEYKWWMTNNGSIISLHGASHGAFAVNYLEKRHEFDRNSVPRKYDAHTVATDLLFEKGWIRLIFITYKDAEVLDFEYMHNGRITNKQLKAIKDFAIERGAKFIHDDVLNKEHPLN